MNRIASLAILPMMVLAIVVFGRLANDGSASAEPPPEMGTVVVANLRTESLTFIDLARDDVRTLQLPGPPHEMVQAGGRLYVTLGRGNAVAEVEPKSGAILRIVPFEGEPHGLAVLGETLLVTLVKANAVVVVDRASLTELRRYPTGDTPHTVAASAGAIVVTDSRDNALRQIEPDAATASAGALPEAIVIVGPYVVSADAQSGSVTIAGIPGLTGARAVAVGEGPVRVTPSAGASVLVSLQGKGQVVRVSVPEGKILKRMDTDERPDGLCPSPDGAYFGVASNGGGTLQMFSTEDWKIAQRINLQPGLGSCLWVER